MHYLPYCITTIDQLKDLFKSVGGVYGIYCIPEDCMYVGSSVNMNNRLRGHFHSTPTSFYLQAAMNRYERKDFIIVVLDVIENKGISKRVLKGLLFNQNQQNQQENVYLHQLDINEPGFLYNIEKDALYFFVIHYIS